jgi:hypothetical protein
MKMFSFVLLALQLSLVARSVAHFATAVLKRNLANVHDLMLLIFVDSL